MFLTARLDLQFYHIPVVPGPPSAAAVSARGCRGERGSREFPPHPCPAPTARRVGANTELLGSVWSPALPQLQEDP